MQFNFNQLLQFKVKSANKFYNTFDYKQKAFKNKTDIQKVIKNCQSIDFHQQQMISDSNEQLDAPVKLADLSYEPIRNISNLSPYHERVIIEQKYLQKKEKLRSILIMGHLKKMELNAINNRSIQTMRKSKAAQQMSKKRYQSVDQSGSLDQKLILKIDNRKKIKLKMKTQIEQAKRNHSERSQKIQMAYDKLIDDYLKQVSKAKLLDKSMDRKKIIQQACNIIKAQMSQQISQLKTNQQVPQKDEILFSQKKTLNKSQQNIHLPSIKQIPTNKKPQYKSDRLLQISTRRNAKSVESSKKYDTHIMKVKPSPGNRSVVAIECTENLKKLQYEQNYLSKQRIRDEKLFLRKMKLIGIKNIRTMRSSLNDT